MTPNKENRAWTAGIVDGEGCISIVKHCSGPYLRVAVGNTDERLLIRLKSLWGGGIYVSPGKEANCKSYWQWMLHGKKASIFLKAIFPYLLLKRERASIAIEFSETIYFPRKDRGEKRAKLGRKMKELNRRGIV